VCDSQKALNTFTLRLRAIAATSRTRRLLPMPGDPTTPWPSIAVQQALDGGYLPPATAEI